jgi:transposase-like protein
MVSLIQLESLCSDVQHTIAFLQEAGILSSNFRCDACQSWMSLTKNGKKSDGFIMRCTSCRIELSIRHGSVLSKSKLTLKEFIYFVYFWCLKISAGQICDLLALSNKTTAKYMWFCREICSWHLQRIDMRIGGIGQIVQIDESVIYRAKYHRGHALYEQQKWMFGLYDVTSKVGLILFVPDRSAATLLPLIVRHVLPGTEIHSDQWSAYRNISALPVTPPFIHHTVNHSLHFSDPLTGIHTNNVEAYWCAVKRKFKLINGARRGDTPSHLDEGMYRERFGRGVHEMWTNFIATIGEMSVFE